MNQAILFNDDYIYLTEQGCWHFTGMLSGAKISIYIQCSDDVISDSLKFDLEAQVEDFLEEDEPDENNVIRL
ncbi:hypothetical protein [Thalassotalea maritima]|uniref:hypothetical protein n=1 Tax=Thalassotalea maritima TaxID=3242416 RepID=UPI00352916DE